MNLFLPELKLTFWSRLWLFFLWFNFSVEESFNWFDPHIKFFLKFLNSLALTHTHKFVELFWFYLEVFHAGLHQLHSLYYFFFKLLDLASELLFSLALSLTPILIVLSVNKRIVHFFHHEVQHSDWVGCNLAVEDILVTSVREIHFLFVLG